MARIVIADDSPTLRRVVTSVLTRDGHEVVAVEDGIAAVQAVLAHQPDAVVLDVQMPRVSGFIAARLLKDDWQTADIPILMLTSLDAASDRYWAGQAGADRYLTKDFEAGDLTGAVADVLAAGRGPLRADPVVVSEADVLSRICELLDRTLYESSVAQAVTAVAAMSHGLEQTVCALLAVLQRFVGHDLAAVLLCGERTAYVSVAAVVSRDHHATFLARSAESLSSYGDTPVLPADLTTVVAGELLHDDLAGPLATYVSMPLRGHAGALVGLLALSSARPHAFGETALSTLTLVGAPAALVVDGARLSGRP